MQHRFSDGAFQQPVKINYNTLISNHFAKSVGGPEKASVGSSIPCLMSLEVVAAGTATCVLRLYSVNEHFGVQGENRPASNRLMLVPVNAMFIVVNQWSISQAGRSSADYWHGSPARRGLSCGEGQ